MPQPFFLHGQEARPPSLSLTLPWPRDPRPSFGGTIWAGYSLGATGMGLVLEPEALALGSCREIKKIIKLGTGWESLEILGPA